MTRIILKKINDSYLLEFPFKADIEIDGKRILDFKEGWLSEKPKTIKLLKTEKKPIKYGKYSPDEFSKKLDSLVSSYDYYGKPIFETLEDEYKYKKLKQENPPEYVEETIKEDLEIVEYDITGRTDNPFIKPFRFVGKEPIKEGKILYKYEPNPYEMAQSIAKQLGFSEVKGIMSVMFTKGKKWSVSESHHDTLEFLNINGEYVPKAELPTFYPIYAGTYEECLREYNNQMAKLRKIFEDRKNKIELKGKSFDAYEVVDRLEKIRDRMKIIKTLRKYTMDYGALKTEVDNLIYEIKMSKEIKEQK